MAYLPRSNTWGRLVCFWLVNAQSVGFTVSLVTISSNMAGYTHRSFASAMVLYALSPLYSIDFSSHLKLCILLGKFCRSFCSQRIRSSRLQRCDGRFTSWILDKNRLSFGTSLWVILQVSTFYYTKLMIAIGYMFFMNKYRDRTYGPANKDESNEAGMQDKTEFENKDFRYVL